MSQKPLVISRPLPRPFYFDDLEVEDCFILHLEREIIREDVVNFGIVSGDFQALHFNKEFAETTVLGGIAVHGKWVLARLDGILHKFNFWEKSLEALVSMGETKFLAPTHIGDMIHYVLTVIQKKPSHNPRTGKITFAFTAINQAKVLLVEGSFTVLLRKKLGEEA